ncbi:MAG TPA: ABC transporter permease [Bryobacteraceae bacterium]|nr:ABC transporter permease [Bryobacteraceae bacterium]
MNQTPIPPPRDSGFQFRNALSLAIESLRAYKLRSFLTLLGIIIGVASVVLVGAAIDGLGVYAEASTSKAFGADSFLVAQIAGGNLSRRQYFDKLRRNKPIRVDDLRFLRAVAGGDVLYSPYRNTNVDIKRDNLVCEDTLILGVSAEIAAIRDVELTDGRFFTDQEERARMPLTVIGETVKERLFPEGSPLNKTIRIQGIDFTVVGVVEKLGSVFGRDQDNSLFIPIGAYDRLFGPGMGFPVFGKPRPRSGLTMQQALDETRVALRTRFHTRPGQPDNFDNLTPDAVRGFIDRVLGMVAAVVVPVTCISLLVGGIVIMNIMLVSVTERTREIGLRKSLGARKTDIMLQILIEALTLALLGGTLGLASGAVLTLAVGRLLNFSLHMTMGYVALAVGVSSIVGIVSGWYPAARAANLDPVEALRAE